MSLKFVDPKRVVLTRQQAIAACVNAANRATGDVRGEGDEVAVEDALEHGAVSDWSRAALIQARRYIALASAPALKETP
jgi:hypothetical protein